MRRLTLPALLGVLALSACNNDQTAPSTTEPGPEAFRVPICRSPLFPLLPLALKVSKVFPTTDALRATALIRVTVIGVLSTTCKTTQAQQGVGDFVKWMSKQGAAGKLIGTNAQKTDLVNSLYAAVGLAAPNLPPGAFAPNADFGNGLFVPGTTLRVQTTSKNAATLIQGDAFTTPTLITVVLRTDKPFSASGPRVFGPHYDITASNASGNHYLANGKALVGFCFPNDSLDPLNNPVLAHLAAQDSVHPGGFETLDPAAITGLGLDCDPYAPPPQPVGFHLGAKVKELAAAAAAVLLPQELRAAALARAGKGGLGGLASSLSPFGATEGPTTNRLEFYNQDFTPLGGDVPVEHTFDLGALPTIQWCGGEGEGCVVKYPSVILRDGDGNPIGGVYVHVDLFQVDGNGQFVTSGDGTSMTTVRTESDDSPIFPVGTALFDDLSITAAPGTYQLKFSVPSMPGVDTLTSRIFSAEFFSE